MSDGVTSLTIGPLRVARVLGGGISALDVIQALGRPQFWGFDQAALEDHADYRRTRQNASRTFLNLKSSSPALQALEHSLHNGSRVPVLTSVAHLNEVIDRSKNGKDGKALRHKPGYQVC